MGAAIDSLQEQTKLLLEFVLFDQKTNYWLIQVITLFLFDSSSLFNSCLNLRLIP